MPGDTTNGTDSPSARSLFLGEPIIADFKALPSGIDDRSELPADHPALEYWADAECANPECDEEGLVTNATANRAEGVIGGQSKEIVCSQTCGNAVR